MDWIESHFSFHSPGSTFPWIYASIDLGFCSYPLSVPPKFLFYTSANTSRLWSLNIHISWWGDSYLDSHYVLFRRCLGVSCPLIQCWFCWLQRAVHGSTLGRRHDQAVQVRKAEIFLGP